jgi:hypothetical protein
MSNKLLGNSSPKNQLARMLRAWQLVFIVFSLSFHGCTFEQHDSSLFGKGEVLGINHNKKLEEASGLAPSIIYPGCVWTINDSGNPPQVFLLDQKAKTKRTFTLSGVKNRDWEDITIGPGPDPAVKYLYVGDIGDNLKAFPLKYIYRFPEPAEDNPDEITEFETLVVKLDDGVFDSEALMCDPISKNLYLLSKQQKTCGVYEIKFPFSADTLIAKRLYDIPYESINAGAISPDGAEVVIKNYDNIYYWKKPGEESIAELLKTLPMGLHYTREPQGEAITWAWDNSGFYTLGENGRGERAKLYFYKRR